MNPAVPAMVVALVARDATPLRAAARDAAPRQTTLAAGDWLEVRGEQRGFLQVYDHRRERPGYVRAEAVRTYSVDEATAPKLGSVVEYLRDAPGEEALGIGYVALFVRAAPASSIGPEVFDALGTMGERLARRASARTGGKNERDDAKLAAQMDVAEAYGVHFARFEDGDRTRVCYDGEAYRHVLVAGAPAAGANAMRARAAMGLTDPECVDPSLGTTASLALVKWQADVLNAVDPGALGDVPAVDRARLRLRRAVVDAELAYFAARGGDPALAQQASESARRELALADRAALGDDDRLAYDEAAIRVATVRWARETPPAKSAGSKLEVTTGPGEPGQTCVHVGFEGSEKIAHCTYGLVWPASIRVAPHDAGVAVVVQPLAGWNELHVLHPTAQGPWVAETMTPATIDPDLGYVEPAGFTPDGAHWLVAREARASGPLGAPHTLAPWVQRLFQEVTVDGLRVEKESTSTRGVPAFGQWASAEWRRGTLAVR